ncbi:perforin-1-like [Platysternon megacephalum]|uniref:Perforin-1-like n=1 Tax=Platysternon megacephalum TaxID=55544 RepID=A0A4D9DNA0_9SAUR|nr:perforin-1-like [Platysternon megacephalum]
MTKSQLSPAKHLSITGKASVCVCLCVSVCVTISAQPISASWESEWGSMAEQRWGFRKGMVRREN